MIIAIVIIAIIFIVVFGFSASYMKKIKSNPDYQNTHHEIMQYTFENQLQNGKAITQAHIDNNDKAFSDIKEKMNGAPIDALISCQYIESLSNKVKSEIKHSLIGALTNTHYEKASTTEVMVLSGKTLHLFIYAHEKWGTTLKGPKEQHIIFTEENLSNAILSEQKMSLKQSIVAKQAGAMKEYPNQLLTLTNHDGKLISFLLYSQTLFGTKSEPLSNVFNNANNRSIIVERAKNIVNQQVIPAYFIQQLKSQFVSIEHQIVE